MSKRIGLYGCTCDPIHFGHLNLAITAKESLNLDELWLFPTGNNPFKKDQSVASKEQRLEMAHLACSEIPGIIVRADEVERQGVSYAIDTLRVLRQEDPKARFFLLVGEDAAKHLSCWKEAESLAEYAEVVVCSREKRGEYALEIPSFEISSSAVRARLAKGLSCAHMVPAKVLEYIAKRALY